MRHKEVPSAGTLYGDLLSPNFARVLVVANELKVNVSIILADSRDKDKEPYHSLSVCL
jgi:hypothetical protein